MKLEQNNQPLLFSTTQISDIFFTEYLSQASGDFIKVYLYMLFLSKYNKEVKVTDLSKKLALSFNTIQEAIKYWETQGVILKKNTGYILNSLQEIELFKLYKPKVNLSSKDIENSNKNKYRAKAIENINNNCFQGIMSPSWYVDIDTWFKKYSFDEQVMIALFEYCLNKSALHRNYVQAVAETWYQNNIKSFTDLDNYYIKQEKFNKIRNTISKKLSLTRPLTKYEEAYIEKWTVQFGYGLDIIEIALKRTTSKANPSFDYLDKLISDWKDRGFTTIAEIQKFLLEFKKKTSATKQLEKQTGYKNYDQRKYNNLDSLYTNAKQALN